MAFTGSCLNCLSTDTKYFEWTVYTVDSIGTRTELTITPSMTTTGKNNENFVLTAGSLPSADSYVFELEISKSDPTSATLQSTSELILAANNKATGGSCSLVTTSPIDPLVDPVQISCSGFSDPDNTNAELNYKVMSHSKDLSSITESVVIYYGTLSSPTFYLAPWPGTTRNAVNIKVYVVDEEGGEVLTLDT